MLVSRGHAIGVRLPNDPSRTLRMMRDRGRPLFRFEGNGWKVTPTGIGYLRARFNMPLGKPSRASNRAA